ncbi:MAG: hypothetical protein ACI35O_16735 [Bacillaceae bacterium]
MKFVIFIFGFLLLITITIQLQTKKIFWVYLQVIILYALLLIYLKIDTTFGMFNIPIGILIGYFLVKRFANIKLLRLAFIFSIVGFVFIYYLTPSIPIKWLPKSIGFYEQIEKFESIDSIEIHSKDDDFQKDISEYVRKDIREDLLKILTYILHDQDIEIKSEHWLLHSARIDLGITVSLIENKENFTIIYASYNDSDYISRFNKEENGGTYMEYVIKGKAKSKYGNFNEDIIND